MYKELRMISLVASLIHAMDIVVNDKGTNFRFPMKEER